MFTSGSSQPLCPHASLHQHKGLDPSLLFRCAAVIHSPCSLPDMHCAVFASAAKTTDDIPVDTCLLTCDLQEQGIKHTTENNKLKHVGHSVLFVRDSGSVHTSLHTYRIHVS